MSCERDTTHMHERLIEAMTIVELAETYVLDGAYVTAATRLRKAADILDEAAAIKNELLSG